MAKRGASANTRSGGQPAQMRFRGIIADPNGNREQRRAAKKLGVETTEPTCPHCGRTSHGFACAGLMSGAPC